ncbi:hypothetical protein N7508_000361 [Penicillium antarcticum]|uniref:uncharacterized protein n=1 Tax=Penicillium antarcticum TaxID=416450 RepID=UPI00239D17EC|nr:uncharacterized protein N7508_000361 [Penicillium antarcticum]KAJ5320078.1 hypothetical protein N7508_000361 [Penicillium antarcticum]
MRSDIRISQVTDGNPSSPSYSDNDGGERPVRQQLKETNLDATTQKNANNKRSHDRSDNDATSEADAPPKKRSRECTPETASRSQDTSSLQKNGSKKRSLDDSDNDATSEADAPPKKRSRECTPEKSSGAQNPTSNTSSGVEQPETDTAPDGYHLPASWISRVPRHPFPPFSPLPDYEDSPSPAQFKSPNFVPFPEENILETIEIDAIPDESVDVNTQSDSLDHEELIRSRSDPVPWEPELIAAWQQLHEANPTTIPPVPRSVRNQNAENVEGHEPKKARNTANWVDEIEASIPATSDTSEAPGSGRGSYRTVHCEASIVISIEGQPQLPVKISFNVQVPLEPGHAQYPAPPFHISISSDEDTPKDDISSHISTSSDEEFLHGDILPSSHLPRTPERTTHTDHFGFEPISNPIFTQETEKPPATMEPTETKTVPPDETLAAEAQRQKTNNSDERKTKMNQTFSSSAFGNTSTDSPFSSAFRSSTTSTSVFGSSMASTSATSPFTTLSANAKEPAVTPNPSNNNNPASTSAFASSSLSAFAGSDDSPFGNLAAGTSTSVFGKPANSTGFSTFSSAFPATGKSGGLTSFASPKVTSSFGDSKAKAQPLGAKAQAFGAVQSDNEDSENEQDDEGNGNDTFVAEKTDERFVEQPVETGEEDEETIFANKGKLYCFDNKQWKERGVGTFKVNVKSGPDGKRTARMIMRADGALRVMLNSAIFKGMHFGDQQGAAPAGRRIFLASKEDGKVANVLLQLNNENTVNELYATLKDFLEEV